MDGYKNIRSLTGARGLAAFWIFTYHMHVDHTSPASDHGPLWIVMAHGYLAVDFFFLLSGFVMALSYHSWIQEGWNKRRYGIFMLHRLGRIYPLYFLTLLYIVMQGGALFTHRPIEAPEFLMNLLLIQSWGIPYTDHVPVFSPMIITWSLSTEFASYLLFPLLALLALKGRIRHTLGLCALMMLVLAVLPWLAGKDYHSGHLNQMDIVRMPSQLPLIRCIIEFTLGLALFRLASTPAVRSFLSGPKAGYAVFLALFMLLMITNSDLAIIATFVLVIAVLANNPTIFSGFFESRPILFLGEISYAMYLIHLPFARDHRMDTLPDILAWVMVYIEVIVLSSLLCFLIEKPCRRWVRTKLGDRPG